MVQWYDHNSQLLWEYGGNRGDEGVHVTMVTLTFSWSLLTFVDLGNEDMI